MLPHDPNEANSWDGTVKQIKIDKDSTTSSTINILLDEKRCHAAANINNQQRQELAMAVLDRNAKFHGKLYCHNCRKETNHAAADCWAPGGGKEGQGPKKKSNRGTTSKHKGKERAQHAIDDVSSAEEDPNVIMFEKAFNTSSSNYDLSENIENQATKDQAYRAVGL